MKTVITTDAAKISRLVSLFPGPVFDLRSLGDDRLLQVTVGEQVSVLSVKDTSLLSNVLRVVKRKRYPLYVIGEEETWQEMVEGAEEVLNPAMVTGAVESQG